MEQISVIAAGVCEQQNMDFDAQMKELCSLAEACGLCVAETFTQKLSSRNPASYFGAGRLLELKERLEELKRRGCRWRWRCVSMSFRV